jgi:hypothetical protein
MTANQIVTKHYSTLVGVCSSICKEEHLLADFTQDMLLIVLEYDLLKLQEMESSNELKWWFSRVCKNQYSSNTSPFYNTYKRPIPDDYLLTVEEYLESKPRPRYEE